jgi:hypothetical protein
MSEYESDKHDIVEEPTTSQKKLYQRKTYKDEYETRIFDMMRAGELSEQDYKKMKDDSTVAFEDFKQQLSTQEQQN